MISRYSRLFRDGAEDAGGEVLRFLQFRLNYEEYYNGDYLSQGRLEHGGRSCMIPLEQLIQARIFQLYPELDDEEGKSKWTNRVRNLPWSWAAEERTTDREI